VHLGTYEPVRIKVVQLTFLPKMSAIYCWKALFTNYFAIGGFYPET